MESFSGLTIKKKRIVWIDTMKCICMFTVMFSHLQDKPSLFAELYTPFFLNGFLFCSGYVYRNKEDFSDFLISKSRTLLRPWLIFSLLNIVLTQILSFHEKPPILQALMLNFFQIRGLGDGMWFLAALFVSFIPFYFIVRMKNKSCMLTIAGALFVVDIVYKAYMPDTILPWGVSLPWHIEYIPSAVIYLLLGYYYKNYIEQRDRAKSWSYVFILLILYAFVVVPDIVSMNMPELLKQILNYFQCIVGVYVIISVSQVLRENRFIEFIGMNSLLYFALHGKFLAVTQKVVKSILGSNYDILTQNYVSCFVLMLAMTLFVCFIIVPIIWGINRYAPWIIGKGKVVYVKQQR